MNQNVIILIITVIIGIVHEGQHNIPRTVATQKELLSRITADTPISGFYGPGAWWAWLITIAMTHGHTIVTLWARRDHALPDEDQWDYDLIGASAYTTFAAIDLILKSRTISRLGEDASTSPLLPALLCAERVVSIGTGSSLVAIVTAHKVGGVAGFHRADVALIPLLLALVASGFVLRAHKAILKTAPLPWCSMHDKTFLFPPFTMVDFPAFEAAALARLLEFYRWRKYWLVGGALGAATAVVTFTVRLAIGRRRSPIRSARTGVVVMAIFCGTPAAFVVLINVGIWVCCWVFMWLPVYILAFFPQMGYFPLTKTSVWEMDQGAALLNVAFVAGLRTWHRIQKIARNRSQIPHLPLQLSPRPRSDRHDQSYLDM